MDENTNEFDRAEFLTQRAIRLYNRYGDELRSISQLLEIKLSQLALAYTLDNGLPREAIQVHSRVKSLQSFLKKLEKKRWPVFYYPGEVINDLVGARVVCWFLDDCYGLVESIRASKQFKLKGKIEDYIVKPKDSGYRSIHLLTYITYDQVKKVGEKRIVDQAKMICEVQVRTKLQDAWAEFTHEVHYKIPEGFEADYNILVAEISTRLASEDRSALAIRNILQSKDRERKHEGFRPL